MADAYCKKILPQLEGRAGELRMMRFWSKVDMRGPDECWEWQGSINRNGYGSFKLSSYNTVTASRMALIGSKMTEPEGLAVLHRCDNPPCCNPAHLYFGTQARNNQDKLERNRWRAGDHSGVNNPRAKLSEQQVVEMIGYFRLGMSNKEIAARLPVSHSTVSLIRLGKMWRPTTARLGWIPSAPHQLTEGRAA